jgi:hypothetical protein
VGAEEVALVDVGSGDLLRRLQPFEGTDLVAQACRFLEAIDRGGGFHLALEPLHHLVRAPLEEEACVVHGLPVPPRLAHLDHTRGQAAADLVLQARPRAPAVQRLLAGADAEDLVDEPRRPPSHRRRDVRTAVRGLVPTDPADDVQARVLLAHRQLQVGMVLVVPQQHVEPRAVTLDEVVLEGQGLDLGVRHHEIDVGHHRDEVPARRVHGPAGLEI